VTSHALPMSFFPVHGTVTVHPCSMRGHASRPRGTELMLALTFAHTPERARVRAISLQSRLPLRDTDISAENWISCASMLLDCD